MVLDDASRAVGVAWVMTRQAATGCSFAPARQAVKIFNDFSLRLDSVAAANYL